MRMNKFLLSAVSFAVFFLFSLTWQVDNQTGIQQTGIQFDVPAAMAGDDKDKGDDKDSDKGSDKDDDKDSDKDSDKNDDKDSDKDSGKDSDDDGDDSAKDGGDDGDSGASSCVCPPEVSSCVCADSTAGTPGPAGGGSVVPNSLRSIHGGS